MFDFSFSSPVRFQTVKKYAEIRRNTQKHPSNTQKYPSKNTPSNTQKYLSKNIPSKNPTGPGGSKIGRKNRDLNSPVRYLFFSLFQFDKPLSVWCPIYCWFHKEVASPWEGFNLPCFFRITVIFEAGADVHRSYRVDIDGEVLALTPLAYTQKLASLFPDKPFDGIIEVLRAADVGVG